MSRMKTIHTCIDKSAVNPTTYSERVTFLYFLKKLLHLYIKSFIDLYLYISRRSMNELSYVI